MLLNNIILSLCREAHGQIRSIKYGYLYKNDENIPCERNNIVLYIIKGDNYEILLIRLL